MPNDTRRAFTCGYSIGKMVVMDQYTNHQLLLMEVRKKFCAGKTAQLARDIGKDGTYVNRLFYPVGKKGGKGVGLEIMTACSKRFQLPPGYWEQDAGVNLLDAIPVKEQANGTGTTIAAPMVMEPVPQFGFKWPFRDVTPQQYDLLDERQREEVEKYVVLQLRSREPPEKQDAPDYKTGT